MSNETDIDKPQPETEQVPWIGIITIIALVFGLCGGVFLGSLYGVRALVTKGMDKRSHIIGTPELNLILEEENKIMTEYKNLGEGKFRIPVARAMELMASEAANTSPAEPDVVSEDPAPAPGDTLSATPAPVTDSVPAGPEKIDTAKKGEH